MNDIAPETDLGSLGEADVVLLGPAGYLAARLRGGTAIVLASRRLVAVDRDRCCMASRSARFSSTVKSSAGQSDWLHRRNCVRVHHRGVVGLRIVDGDGAQHELIVPQPLEEDAVGIGQSHEAPRMPYS